MPLAVAVDRDGDCLLATEMNGEPLPPDHGYPVRAFLPGIIGARNVKWLTSITLRKGEGNSPWQTKYYRVGQPERKTSAFRLPLQCIILSPAPDAAVAATGEDIDVHGVAYSGGSGARITSVQVSMDGGARFVSCVVWFHSFVACPPLLFWLSGNKLVATSNEFQ